MKNYFIQNKNEKDFSKYSSAKIYFISDSLKRKSSDWSAYFRLQNFRKIHHKKKGSKEFIV